MDKTSLASQMLMVRFHLELKTKRKGQNKTPQRNCSSYRAGIYVSCLKWTQAWKFCHHLYYKFFFYMAASNWHVWINRKLLEPCVVQYNLWTQIKIKREFNSRNPHRPNSYLVMVGKQLELKEVLTHVRNNAWKEGKKQGCPNPKNDNSWSNPNGFAIWIHLMDASYFKKDLKEQNVS